LSLRILSIKNKITDLPDSLCVKLVNKYRCPNCSTINSIKTERIFDGRILFICEKCDICCVIPFHVDLDETYLDFLEQFDTGSVTLMKDFKTILELEKLVRSKNEIKEMIEKNDFDNELINNILYSETDYIVDIRKLIDSDIQDGKELEELPLCDLLLEQVRKKDINKLFKFQEDAIVKILRGKDIVIIAPTASGKTEAFCLPVIQKIYDDNLLKGNHEKIFLKKIKQDNNMPTNRVSAIFVYPTKALGRDQFQKINYYANNLDIEAKIFDGDLDESEKQAIYDQPPEILITNFDMIHYHLLNKTRFVNLFKNIKFLVVDEVHTYNGVFGSNIYFIIKRLERILSSKEKLQIIACSATLPNANEFCNQLFDRQMEIIKGTGRKGVINFSIIYPSLRSNRSLRLDLIRKISKKHKTLVFSNSHISAELLAFNSSRLGIKIGVHRAGLLPKVRKIMENSFRSGKLDVLSSTPTLELGIDIGDVDSVISNLVPVNRLLQRLGRAARSGQEGFAFLTLGNDPISQYYKNHPEDYFCDYEYPYIDPRNPIIEENQILAMCSDRPISLSESKKMSEALKRLVNEGLIVLKDDRYITNSKSFLKLKNYSIRGTGKEIDIIFDGKVVGYRNLPYALEELHKDAIYFIAGKRYKVNRFVLDNRSERSFAEVEMIPSNYPYYTKAMVEEIPEILEIIEQKNVYGIQLKYCLLKILKRVTGYSNIEIGKEINQGKKVLFENPEIFEYVTKGFIFKAPRPLTILEKIRDKELVETSGYHATEHVIIEGSSMITGGASQDLGGISLGDSGIIVVHDGSIGGNGASKSLYDRFEQAVIRAHNIINECPCETEDGCPRCTYSYRCGNNNEYLHKKAALEILARLKNNERTEELVAIEDIYRTFV